MSHELPTESNDDLVLKMLSGATFGPDTKLVLPSGRVLSGNEAQAFTSAFSSEDHTSDATSEQTRSGPRDLQDEQRRPLTRPPGETSTANTRHAVETSRRSNRITRLARTVFRRR